MVAGLHGARAAHFRQKFWQRTQALRGQIAAAPKKAEAERVAAAEKARMAAEETARLPHLRREADEAEEPVREVRDALEDLPAVQRGYISDAMRDRGPIAVAVAIAPLFYLSTRTVTDYLVVRVVVVEAAIAAVYIIEYFLGAVLAELARRLPVQQQLRFLVLAVAVVAGLAGLFEVAAGIFREQALHHEGHVSTLWTIPLGMAATVAGSGIVAVWHLGEPGRLLRTVLAETMAGREYWWSQHGACQAAATQLHDESLQHLQAALAIEAGSRQAEGALEADEAATALQEQIEQQLAAAHIADGQRAYLVAAAGGDKSPAPAIPARRGRPEVAVAGAAAAVVSCIGAVLALPPLTVLVLAPSSAALAYGIAIAVGAELGPRRVDRHDVPLPPPELGTG